MDEQDVRVKFMRLIDAVLTAGEEMSYVTPEALGDEFADSSASFYDGAIHVTIDGEKKIFDLVERK